MMIFIYTFKTCERFKVDDCSCRWSFNFSTEMIYFCVWPLQRDLKLHKNVWKHPSYFILNYKHSERKISDMFLTKSEY